ncbi:MAG TPA: ribosome biogenesis GTPase Der [Rhizomicrobium sp.]|jgi:GTP-binding protein
MPPCVAILGCPNVGKSTLFNRLAGGKVAIVHDTPGVTRDRQEKIVQWGDLVFRLVDTAGFDTGARGELSQRMTDQTLTAIRQADVCAFVIDARAGVTAGDDIMAKELRRSGKRVILVANKCEGRISDLADALKWGFGDPVEISSEHGRGLGELFDALAPLVADAGAEEPVAEEARPLKLAIVGRPNVGKSTLFNRLLGEERTLTGPEAGTTRDSVAAAFESEGRTVLLHDTAGLRKRAKAAGNVLEQLAIGSALTAIRFAECVIVVIDSTQPFEKQDLTIADLVAREGRAILFAISKWDLSRNKPGAISAFARQRDRLLPQIAGAPLVAVSALTGEGMARLIPAAIAADRAWNRHVPTSELNRLLSRALDRHPPPAIKGRRVRVRYMTQPKSRPPTFALFGNQLDSLPQSWLRYLQNELRASFDFAGTPLRFSLRTSKNPYA